MSDVNRRRFLTAAGAGAVGLMLPALSGLSPAAAAGATPWTRAVAAGADGDDLQSRLAAVSELRFGMFNHFNLGTYTDEEWAAPNQSPLLFAPPTVDTDQWAAAAAAAKMQYAVLTTKHHDGFALWPTAFGTQNVAYSGYQQDIVAQYVTSMRNAGLRVGLYFSIWDRTHPVQAQGGHVGDPGQVVLEPDMDFVLGQIRELLTNYGVIDMFITDGYGWQMGQRALHYGRIRQLIRELQPNTIAIDHGGLSVPWIGDAIYFEEPLGVTSPAGNTYAGYQGQTVSNGWFWHPSTPSEGLMSRADILGHLADLEPKYTSFLLNCPPNRNGRLDANIVGRLAEIGAAWSPNLSRAPLPIQPPRVNHRVVPTGIYATNERSAEQAPNAIDGYSDSRQETCWSTWPGTGALTFPQTLTVDLGGTWSGVSALEYLPKQWNRNDSTDGDITDFEISVSTDGTTYSTVASSTWPGGSRTPRIQEWAPVPAAYLRFTAKAATGGYLNVGDLHIGSRTQAPTLVSAFPKADTGYRLVARHSGKVLGVMGGAPVNGATAEQQTWTGADHQIWRFTRTADGYFQVSPQNSSLVLEAAGRSRVNNGVVDVATDEGSPSQRWSVTPVGAGQFVVMNRLSGLVLNVDGVSSADGAKVTQWHYDKVAQQEFQVVPVTVVEPPTAAVAPAGKNGWYGAGASVTLTAAAGLSADLKIGTQEWASYTEPVRLPAGSYDLAFRSRTTDGVTSREATLSVKVDGTVPTVTAALSGRSVSVTAADSGGSAVDSVEYRMDGGDWQPYTAPVTVDQAAHVVGFRATDTAGNVSTEGSLAVPSTSGQVQPVVAITAVGPATPDGWYRSSVLVGVSSSDSALVVQSRLDNGSWRSGQRSMTLSTNGSHTVDSRLLRDNQVVTGSATTTVVKIDRTAPTVGLARVEGTSSGTPRNPVSVTFTAADAVSGVDSIEYKTQSLDWTLVDPAGPVVFDQVGSYAVACRSTDKAGNVSRTVNATILIAADPTTAIVPSVRKLAAGSPVTLSLKGFRRFDAVSITTGGREWAVVRTDVQGAARVTVSVPGTQAKGLMTVAATGVGTSASATLTIV